MMSERKNIGYVITDSVRIGETEFVIGAHEKDPNRFVTWACKDGNNYFWGHYLNSRDAAERDLVARCQEQLRFLDSIRGKPPKAKGGQER